MDGQTVIFTENLGSTIGGVNTFSQLFQKGCSDFLNKIKGPEKLPNSVRVKY